MKRVTPDLWENNEDCPMSESGSERGVVLCEGDFRASIEQETVHMKAVDRHGDPIELNEAELLLVIKELTKLLDETK
jgi:hypothetical protein